VQSPHRPTEDVEVAARALAMLMIFQTLCAAALLAEGVRSRIAPDSKSFSSRILGGELGKRQISTPPVVNGTASTDEWQIGQAVRTSSGLIVGHSASNRPDVSEYLGIPFAKAPVGSLRFAPPEPFTHPGTLQADAYVSPAFK
jgi:hypothetical protein